MNSKISNYFILGTFVSLYTVVSLISTIHVIDFFSLSNPKWLAVSLAIAFEIGAAASLASIITMEKMNKTIVWTLFFVLTAMQAMGNTYYAYTNLKEFTAWIELFGLVDEDVVTQKRILSLISGAILPLVALGFIKSLVDYLKPSSGPLLENDVVPLLENDVVKEEIPAEPQVSYPSNDGVIQQNDGEQEPTKAQITEDMYLPVIEETSPNPLDEIKVFKR